MPTVFLAPDPLQSTFFIPGGNTPGNGVQLFLYASGSSTKQTAYHDSAGSTAWTNPIVLDSGGNLPLGGEVWFTQGLVYKAVWAPSNDSDPPASPYRTMDNLSGINDVTTTTSEWNAAPAPSFISASSFSMAGDQTATGNADVGRRMKFTVTAGTVYGTITARSFGGGVTTVTMDMDSTQVLDSGLSAAFYSILSATNTAVPLLRSDQAVIMDYTDPTKRVQFSVSTVASGSTAAVSLFSQLAFRNFLSTDVVLGNVASTFQGPIVSQGSTGVWFASGSVQLYSGAISDAVFYVKLWDGTTTMASAVLTTTTDVVASVHVSGFFTNPSGDIRIAVKNPASVNGLIQSTAAGIALGGSASAGSVLSAFRIA